MTFVITPYRASVSLAAPAETASGANASIAVAYTTNTPSEMFMLSPLGESTCPSTWQSAIGKILGFNPFFDPITEAQGRFLGNQLSGNFLVSVPPPPHPGRYVVCAWLQAGSASAGPFSTSYTALSAGHLPTPSPSHGKAYRGHTSQRLPLVLAYAHSRISDLTFEALFRCTNTHGLWRERIEVGSFRVSGHGKFSHHWNQGSDRGTVQARVRGSTITGTLTESYRSQTGSTCRTPSVRFRATAR
jgi:hypothetical protein